jgi:transcriptional regulator with XRE-family HTH domain
MTVGQRIKKIRSLRGLTQRELGEKIGFAGKTADVRIAQYEAGTRTPKEGLLEKMADVLEVSPNALAEPDLNTHVGVMCALFALEDMYGARIGEVDGKMCLVFDDGIASTGDYLLDSARRTLNDMLRTWQREATKVEKGEITLGEYDEWRFGYPESEGRRNAERLKEGQKKRKERK